MTIISKTAEQHGFGSSRWKWVSYMTAAERAAARAGEPVWFMSRPCNDSPQGWRIAVARRGRFLPRCPRNIGLPDEPFPE